MADLELAGDEAGIAEYSFAVPVDGEQVPGLLWRPSGSAGPGPAVLLGHGRSGHKRNLVQLARLLAGRGYTAVALDAPGHGERRPPGAGPEYVWPRPDADQVIREWQACLDLLKGETDTAALGYWGLSMGSGLGIPLLTSEPRLRAAVLGLMHPNWPAPPGERIRADAGRITCPVLFIINWDDQRAPRSQAFELYELLGSTDKRLHAYPGDHGELPGEALETSADFLGRYLGRP